MTIKSRNRVTLAFFIIATVIFGLSFLFTLYLIFTDKLIFPQIDLTGLSTSTFLAFNQTCLLISIFLEMAYVCTTSFIILKSFEKTQATDMLFFLLFLLACLFDCAKLMLPIFGISGTFSDLLIKIGNATLFARLVAPMALFGTTILSTEEFKQYTDYNCLIIILTAGFFANFIPMNTSVILPNLSVSFSFFKIIKFFAFIVCFISIIFVFFYARKNDYRQLITIGFALLCTGYSIQFNSYSIISTIAAPIILTAGTVIYLTEVHRHYLWVD